MGYVGQQVPIPLGQLGLQTDDSTSNLPPNALLEAFNIDLFTNKIAKSAGSSKYSISAMSGGVVHLFDWWPTPSLQRTIALTSDGKVFRETGTGAFSSIKTGLGSLTPPGVKMAPGGAEASGNNKKLFIFTDQSQVQVIDGDGSSTSDISGPPSDWASNYPTFGGVYNGRLFGFGNSNDRHRIYFSTTADHEDFSGASLDFSVFPGEADGLQSGIVYRGLLFLFKKPAGVYILDGRDPITSNWTVSKYSDSFGISSPHAAVEVLGDLLIGNSTGSINSLAATDKFGDVESGDVLANSKIEQYLREILTTAGFNNQHAIYYPEKKQALYTARSQGSNANNRIIKLDVARGSVRPTIEDKDEPVCLALRRDSNGIQRPMYGTSTGEVFIMDATNYNVDGVAYNGVFQTNYTDLSFIDPKLAGVNKIFDFLQVDYQAVGNFTVTVDIYIDGQKVDTKDFTQSAGGTLDSFVLDTDALGGNEVAQSIVLPLENNSGRRISFRCYNTNVDEWFSIERFVVYFRLSGEQQF